jgi:hypothetical protein
MLPDFRFVLGAILAIALLAVAGLGLVTSVQLLREAHMGPLEDQRSLAFAGHAERNPFYDPDSARRFEGLAEKTEGPVAPARLETPAEPPAVAVSTVPLGSEERIASIPAHRLDPDIANGKSPEIDPPHIDPPLMTETSAPTTIAAPPAETAPPAPDVPGTAGSGAPLADRVASLPATSPGPDRSQETPMQTPMRAQPQAAVDALQSLVPPTPRPRPKTSFRKRIARAHNRRIDPASQQTSQNSGFPPPWPVYDNQFTGTTIKKNAGNITGTLANRPQ